MNFDNLLNFNKLGKSNDLLLWIVLIVIIVGFGKSGNTLGINLFKGYDCEEDKHSRRHYKDNVAYNKPIALPGSTLGGINNIFGENGFFILLVIAILFLCKDEKQDCNKACIDGAEEKFED